MRMGLCVRAAATAVIALVGYMAPSTISFEMIGVNSAEAAQFYSRKRINGQWVTGRFPKSGAAVPVSRMRQTGRARTRSRITEVPASAVLTALPPELRRGEPATPAGPLTTGSLGNRVPAAALPDVEAALVTAAVGPVPPADEAARGAEERLARLRRALEARADELKAKSETAHVTLSAAQPAGPSIAEPAPTAVVRASLPDLSSAPLSTTAASGTAISALVKPRLRRSLHAPSRMILRRASRRRCLRTRSSASPSTEPRCAA